MKQYFMALALWVAFCPGISQGKSADSPLRNPNDPLDQGGETCATATPILSLPFCDTGSTVGADNDYIPPCATVGHTAGDRVYVFTPSAAEVVNFSLCGSLYNSALSVWSSCPGQGGSLVCCSDNTCGDDGCCTFSAHPGQTYYVIVDGRGANEGLYSLKGNVGGDVCDPLPCQQINCNYDSLRDEEPTNNMCLAPPTTILCGDTICGRLSDTDNDYYVFVIPGIGWYDVTIDIFGDDTPGFYPYGHGLDPRMEIQTCDQVYVADSDGGIGADARINSYCLAAGAYLLKVAPQDSSGPYMVATSCEPCTSGCTYSSIDIEPANGNCNLAMATVECGDTLCGTLIALDSIDYYRLDITGAGLHTLTINIFGDDTPGYFPFGQGLDPRVFLLSSPCSGLIASDADGGVGEDVFLFAEELPAGTYYLQVESTFMTPGGPYVMTVNCSIETCAYSNRDTEPNGTCNGGGGGTIFCPDTVCGNQELGSNDYYFLSISGPTCKTVTIDVFGDDTPGYYPFGRGLNPVVSLFGLAGGCFAISSDENSGIGEDARLVSPCLAPGFYRLHVAAQPQATNSGPYVIATSYTLCACATCDYPNGDVESNNSCTNYSGGSITCGDTVCGAVTDSDGPDLLNFTVLGFECKVVTIDAFGDDTPGFYPYGLGLNTHLILYDDTTCVPLAQDDNDGVGSDARLQVCLDPGIYRLRIAGGAGGPSIGPWIIATACEPCDPPPCAAPDSVVIHYPASLGVGNPLGDVELLWPPVPGADEYRIYRSSDNNNPVIVSPANLIASTTNTFYVDENVVAIGPNEVWLYAIVSFCQPVPSPCDTSALSTSPTLLNPRRNDSTN